MENERERWALWVPVCLGIGIALFFIVPPIPLSASILFLALSLGLNRFCYVKLQHFLPHTTALLLIALGYLSIQYHTQRHADAPIIEEDLGVIWIRATLDKIEERNSGKRIYLSNPDLWQPETKRFPARKTPHIIRLNIRTPVDEDILPGDRVSLRAVLSPPPKRATYPQAYDFSFWAFYQEIGAVGFSISPVKLYKENKHRQLSVWLSTIRHTIIKNILTSMPDNTKHIATALLTGERGAIPKKVTKAIRNTGLGHLLAISGLHMALVMVGVFTFSRLILACIERICLQYDIKKWAAIIAMFAGLFYLCMTGFPISAKRAYIMASLVFLAILFDRVGTSMRILAIAATCILIYAPESLFTASFQMSFASVTALIAFFERPAASIGNLQNKPSCFERLTYSFDNDIISQTWWFKMRKYLLGIMCSSLVAGLSTMPLAIYHFGHFSIYGVAANLFAIPLTTLWIMPWGIVSILLMPVGLESLALYPMHIGIESLVGIANNVQTWPRSNILIAHFESFYIAASSLCLLWICIWQNNKYRLTGVVTLICISAIYFSFYHKTPDIIINEDGKLYALRGADNQYYFSSLQKARYARQQWLQMLGKEKAYHIRDIEKYSPNTSFSCNNHQCSYNHNGRFITFITLEDTQPNEQECSKSFMVINLLGYKKCTHTRTITRSDLNSSGTHAIYLKSPSKIITVEK